MNYSWITKILFTKISSQNAWLVDEDEKGSVLGTNNSQTQILSQKFPFKENSTNHKFSDHGNLELCGIL